MLTYEDIAKVLTKTKGIKGASISFGCIVFTSSEKQPKGLYIQTGQDDNLQAAITNGAVAAVWPAQKALPFYTPNHFPVFLSEQGTDSAVIQILEQYSNKVSLELTEGKTMLRLPPSEAGTLPTGIVDRMKHSIHSEKKGTDRNGVR